MKTFITSLAGILIFCFYACESRSLTVQNRVSSPDGEIILTVKTQKGQLYYAAERKGRALVGQSKLGFRFQGMPDLGNNVEITGSESRSFNETWEQPWGERRLVENKYDELILYLQEKIGLRRRFNLVIRVFNDGFGFRYEIPEQTHLDSFKIMNEMTEFVMPEIHNAWWIPAYKDRFYESLFRHTAINQMDTVCTPLTMERTDGSYIAIHEANLTDYAAMNLYCVDSSKLTCDLTPWSSGVKVYGKTPFVTPWRVLIVADKPGDLISSYLILNLNEPCKIPDVSWIKPGKYIGIWWGMHQGFYTWSQGPRHGATTANTKKYIDFAAAHQLDGVLVEGWNRGWDGDWTQNGDSFSFTESYPDFDMEEITRYAKEKNVGMIGHHETGGAVTNYENQLEAAYSLYQRLGVNAVKTGYVNTLLDGKEMHKSQYGVRHYRKVVETAARYHIMVDIHEPVMPTGIQRTYPNLMTQEGVRGQEWDAWSTDGGNPPDHTTIIPFTRGLAGPMDFTPGTFNFSNHLLPQTRVRTTLAKQLALYVVLYSPLQMASDLIENYRNNKAFEFIMMVPVNWEESRVLDARIGDYVITARKDRNSEDWYVGAITDDSPRELTLCLSFLLYDKTYLAQIFKDGNDASWEKNPVDLTYNEIKVNSSDKLTLTLASGGGQAIRFTPAD
ncbi:MAG: glycoside hydrolase family 97 protein [Bacteroidales bacterium]|nr:glycoside hydrolase family 97 protein [Bacteroidales bacterium]